MEDVVKKKTTRAGVEKYRPPCGRLHMEGGWGIAVVQFMTKSPKYSGRWKSGFSVPTGFHIP